MTNSTTKNSCNLREIILEGLSDGKALDLKVFEVRDMTTIADYMVIATGA